MPVRSLGLKDFPGVGNGNPLHYSCLGNPMDRGAWWAIVYKVAKSGTRLSSVSATVCGLQTQQKGYSRRYLTQVCKHSFLITT